MKKIFVLIALVCLCGCVPKTPGIDVKTPNVGATELDPEMKKRLKEAMGICEQNNVIPQIPEGTQTVKFEGIVELQETDYVDCKENTRVGKMPVKHIGKNLDLEAPSGIKAEVTEVTITNERSCHKSSQTATAKKLSDWHFKSDSNKNEDVDFLPEFNAATKSGEVRLHLVTPYDVAINSGVEIRMINGLNLIEIKYFNNKIEVASKTVAVEVDIQSKEIPGVREVESSWVKNKACSK